MLKSSDQPLSGEIKVLNAVDGHFYVSEQVYDLPGHSGSKLSRLRNHSESLGF